MQLLQCQISTSTVLCNYQTDKHLGGGGGVTESMDR